MIREIDRYYNDKDEPGIILEQDEEVAETRKWGMPCFTFRKKMFCFLWEDKLTVGYVDSGRKKGNVVINVIN